MDDIPKIYMENAYDHNGSCRLHVGQNELWSQLESWIWEYISYMPFSMMFKLQSFPNQIVEGLQGAEQTHSALSIHPHH